MASFRLQNINLRYKTVLYFSLGLVGMVTSFLFISRYFFMYSLNELENMEISRASQQAQSVISMMVTQQEERSYDWASWDETYYLLIDGDVEAYRAKNMYVETLNTLSLDLMAIASLNGKVVDYLARDNRSIRSKLQLYSLIEHPLIIEHINKMNAGPDAARDSLSGLFKVSNELWSVSITPVRNSEETLASTGWLIWGKNLTSRFPGNFQSILTTRNALELVLPQTLKSRLTASATESLTLRTSSNIELITPIKGLDGSSIAYLKTQIPREHYNKGNTLFSYLFAVVGLSTTFIAGFTFFVFRRSVATRFNSFEKGLNGLFAQYELDELAKGRYDELDKATRLVEVLSNNAINAQDLADDTMQKYRALYDSHSVAVLVILNGYISDVNEKALNLLNYPRERLVSQPLSVLCPESEHECQVDAMYEHLEQGQYSFEATMVSYDQDEIDCRLEAAMILHNGEKALMLIVHDLREQKQQQKLIRELEIRDSISGLSNRPTILDRIQTLIETVPNQFSIVYISCDQLKRVSEVYGHLIFDDAIRFISKVFQGQTQHYEIGRLSEFEFIAIIPTLDEFNQATQFGNRLIDALAHPTEIEGLSIDLNCKVVLVDPILTHRSLEYLLQACYYAAQLESHNHEVLQIAEQVAEQAQISLLISRELKPAIDSGKIGAYYQPIIDTVTGEVNGFEALARWFHPSLGIVSPNIFIPLAEQNQLIVELGEAILYQACRFIHRLNRQRACKGAQPLSIHVNLSARHFYHTRLTEFLEQVMDQFEIGAGQLVLELTESMLMGVEAETIHRMKQIKELGIQIALDDFGTGYASFSTLCSFPLDIVKLDKSYIDQVETNDKARTILRSIACMAHELGLTTVAEGVENSTQLRKLKVWNIDEIQGYYFYKPMSEDDALKHFSL